jgi:hypothetical protein
MFKLEDFKVGDVVEVHGYENCHYEPYREITISVIGDKLLYGNGTRFSPECVKRITRVTDGYRKVGRE